MIIVRRGAARLWFGLALALVPVPVLAQQPLDMPIQVSATSSAEGGSTRVGVDAAGNFVVVWASVDDGSGRGIAARRFDAAGNAIGPEFRVNTATTGVQTAPDVAVAETGEFVVVWHGPGPSGGPAGVFARRYDAAGVATDPEFQVNMATTLSAEQPAVAPDPRGGFVVAWESYTSPADRRDIFARRYDAAGNAGAEFRVNEQVTADEVAPTVGVDEAGNVVVSWFSHIPFVPSSRRGAYRRFDASDAPVGGEVSFTGSHPTVAVAPDGGFMLVWSEFADHDSELRGQTFDAAGAARGPAFLVAPESVAWPSVATDPARDGEFVVAWYAETYRPDTEDWFDFRIEGRSFNGRGDAMSSQFLASPISPLQYIGAPDVAVSSGHFVVAWTADQFGPTTVLARRLGSARLAGRVTRAGTGQPIAGARVSVLDRFSVQTDEDGRYAGLLPGGTYNVRAEAAGYGTIIAIGVVVAPDGTTTRDFVLTPLPVLHAGAAMDDSGPGGNGNGALDPNERFQITVSLRNSGAAPFTAVSATLETLTPAVFFLQSSGTFPDIGPGETVTNAGFEAFTDVSFPRGALVKLRLRVSTAQGNSTFVLSMPMATATTHTAFHGTGPVDIPDRSRVPGVMVLPVSGFEGPVQRVVLRVHVTHPDLSGLTLRLVAPDGEAATLVSVGDLSGGNLGTGCPAGVNDTTFDVKAVTQIRDGSAPYVGAFRGAGLSELEGKSGAAANGTWRLEVTDNIGSYGTVSSGRIECARLLLHGPAAATGGYVEVRVAGVVSDAGTGLPIEGATVSTATGFSTVTGPDGAYSLDVLPGTFDVVASAPAHDAVRVPVTATGGTQTVNFALPSVVLAASSAVVDDAGAGGNGNGVADRNERFRLSIGLANAGAGVATGVSAVLSTSAPGVALLQGASAYPDIPPGGMAANSTAFELQTAEDFVPGRTFDLRLTVQHDQGAATVPIVLPTGTPLASPTAFEASGPVTITTDAVNGARLLIPVAGAGSSASKVVVMLHIKHPDASRVTLRLEGPDGTRVTLVDRIPGQPPPGPDFGTDCPADANDTTFDDAATLWIGTAHVPRAGSFRPEQPLAAFTGKDPNGTWTLRAFHNGGATGTLECARLLVYGYASADAVPPADRIFADGFESGDVSAWSGVSTDNGDVRASAAAAMAGTAYGLETVVNDTQALHVRDETPEGEPRYRARFHFDPNGFDPGESMGKFRAIVFLALDESPVKRVVQLILRRLGGLYSLQARVALDDGSRAETPFVSIADGPHVVEFDWVQASAPGASDGSFQLWIDGVAAPALAGLDNDDQSVDLARMGAMTLKPGASGSMYFDRFDSRRATYIGP